jgi:hypothetical protein
MKKALLLLPVFFLLFSNCRAPRLFVGITEQEFVKTNGGLELIEASSARNVYKKTNYPFGKRASTKFFYFVDGKLVQMDEGVNRADITIQHVND